MSRQDHRGAIAGEAKIEYLDGDFRVMRPGSHVLCAVTGKQIPLDELRYWDVDLQEAYASPQAKLDRMNVGVTLAVGSEESGGA